MNRTIEKWHPIVIGVLASIGWWFFEIKFPTKPEILESSLTFGAIITGFLATAQAIIMSIKGTDIYHQLVESGFSKDLIRYMKEAVVLSLLFCFISFVGFFISVWEYFFSEFWVGIGITMVLAFWRLMVILFRILELDSH